MEDNRDSYLVNALLDNYEEPLDISLISTKILYRVPWASHSVIDF